MVYWKGGLVNMQASPHEINRRKARLTYELGVVKTFGVIRFGVMVKLFWCARLTVPERHE